MKIAICTLMKNGHEYLKEWLDYHFSIGIDTIFIYEDYSSKSHSEICSEYPNVVLESVSHLIESDANDVTRQGKVCNAFIRKHRMEYDWVAFIDLDEFIMLEDGLTLDGLLEEYRGESGLFMFWKMFKSDGRIENPHTPLMETYKTECELPLPTCIARAAFKSIVNLNHIHPSMIDHHEVRDGVNVDRQRNYRTIMYKKIWLNHYFARSWEEWSERFFKRGHICKGNRKIEDFFLINPEMEHMKQDLIFNTAKLTFQKQFGIGLWNKK